MLVLTRCPDQKLVLKLGPLGAVLYRKGARQAHGGIETPQGVVAIRNEVVGR